MPSSASPAPLPCAPPVPVFGRYGRAAGAGAAAPGRCATGTPAGFCAAGALGRCAEGTCAAGVDGRGVAVAVTVVGRGVVGAGGGGGGGTVAVVGAGVGVGAATVRLSWTAVPSTLGSVPVCVAGTPPTAKLTVAPGVVQPEIACTSTMYWLLVTVPKPHATPPIVAVTVVPVGTTLPLAPVTVP